MTARVKVYDNISQMFVARTSNDRFDRAEDSLWGATKSVLSSGVQCQTTGTIINLSFFADYSFSTMAADETAAGDKTPPPHHRRCEWIA